MASISGISGSSMTSSLYNSSNIISGLASGMDTEGMIESLVKGYQTKIDQLGQKATKLEWKQDAYRSIIAKMYSFSSKYASYTSNTNLMSTSFFSNAVRVSTLGKYADAVSASGRTSSDISLNAVHQLATATQFRTSSNLVSGEGNSIEASTGVDLNGKTTLAKLNGGLTLTYGSQTVSISFDQVADVKAMNDIRDKLGKNASEADVLAELINQKLSGQTISLSGGKSADATERIKVSVTNGMISFSDKSSAGNSVFISGASGNVGSGLGIDSMLKNARTDKDKPRSFAVITDSLTYEMDNKEYLSGKTMNMSLDGVSKTITLPKIVQDEEDEKKYYIEDAKGKRLEYNAENYEKVLSDAVQDAFKGKVKVSNTAKDGKSLQLRFDVQEGSNLVINSSVGETLGIGQIATSYLNTNKTLGELLGEDKLKKLTPVMDEDGKKPLLDKNGDQLYTFEINGVKVGNYSKNSTLAELMDDINKSDAGVKVSYSQTTKNFLFTAKDTGSDGEIELGDGLASAIFGVDHSSMRVTDLLGEDIASRDFSFKINGEEFNGKIESNSETMKDLLDTINKALQDKGYTGYEASYDPSRGLIIKNGKNEVEVEYGDDPLGDIVKKVEAQDHSKDKLVDILGGTSIKGKKYTFTIGEGDDAKTFTNEFLSDAPTMNDLVKRLNDVVLKDSGYTASYSKDRGLLITDSEGKEVKVNYGDDPLGNIVKAVEVKDYSKDKLTGILGKNIVDEKEFSFEIDGQTFTGKIESNKETMGDLLKTINGALKAKKGYEDYTASFSAATGELVIKDAEGREAKVDYGADSLLSRIMDKYDDTFEAADNKNGYTKGQDAIFDVTVNGERMQMTRTSNSVNIDGLTFNMHETFNTKMKSADNGEDEVPDLDQNGRFQVDRLADAVTFKSSTDSDKIIDAIKSMVEDYNIMMAEIKSAYSTMPYQNSNGSFANYEPLTDSDKEGMSESAIERYEEKAKQGILFGDQTLSMLYNKMNQAFSFANRADVDTLKDMGITVNYSTSAGLQAVTIDEEKLRAALDSDPDRVADLFTKTDGIMDRMKTQLDNYARTTGEPKGILIQQAGSPLSSLSLMNNTWQTQIDNISTQIEKWQDKLSAQVDRYTQQFSRMEQLINQLNSQSSALASLMGGSSY